MLAGLFVIGAIVALPCLRLRDLYLALGTMAFALVVEQNVLGQIDGFATDSKAFARWTPLAGDRAYFVAVAAVIGAFGLVAGQFVRTPALQLTFLVIAAIGVYAPYGPFWAVPSAILRPEVVGVSMGLINIANLGGFMGAYVVGFLHSATGSDFGGFLVLAACLVIVAVVFLLIGADRRIAEQAKACERSPATGPLPHS